MPEEDEMDGHMGDDEDDDEDEFGRPMGLPEVRKAVLLNPFALTARGSAGRPQATRTVLAALPAPGNAAESASCHRVSAR